VGLGWWPIVPLNDRGVRVHLALVPDLGLGFTFVCNFESHGLHMALWGFRANAALPPLATPNPDGRAIGVCAFRTEPTGFQSHQGVRDAATFPLPAAGARSMLLPVPATSPDL
jgi:hypothetical protein